MFIFEGNEIETDSEGYLKDTTQWSEAMAEVIAAQEGITLAVEHWEVVRFVREFYLEFNTSPAIRMLVKAMANKFGLRAYISHYLFPGDAGFFIIIEFFPILTPARKHRIRFPVEIIAGLTGVMYRVHDVNRLFCFYKISHNF